jgi:hypothetical protein
MRGGAASPSISRWRAGFYREEIKREATNGDRTPTAGRARGAPWRESGNSTSAAITIQQAAGGLDEKSAKGSAKGPDAERRSGEARQTEQKNVVEPRDFVDSNETVARITDSAVIRQAGDEASMGDRVGASFRGTRSSAPRVVSDRSIPLSPFRAFRARGRRARGRSAPAIPAAGVRH